MAPLPKHTRRPIFQLRVTLQDIQPEIWRRLLVPSNIRLPQLHAVLQAAMGWRGTHDYAFDIAGCLFGTPTRPENRRLSLKKLVGPGDTFHYIYDFGDYWRHSVEIDAAPNLDPRLTYPLCTGGARACPPEDCGGAGGYESLLDILDDRDHEEHDLTLAWLGGHFDPEGFDVYRTNQAIWEGVVLLAPKLRPRAITSDEAGSRSVPHAA